MHYLIQNSGVADTFASKLITALNALGINWTGFGCTPDGTELVGLEDVDLRQPTILFGSVKANELVTNLSEYNKIRPCVFYDESWFNPSYPLFFANSENMLNESMTCITVDLLRDHWISEPKFIKSVYPKLLTGQVIEPEEKVTWFEENIRLSGSDCLQISPIQTIDAEIRFFIIGGKVITGSYYRKDRLFRTNIPVSADLYTAAQKFADIWLPHETIVMDICQLRSGEFKIVEFNCLTASGLYNCDALKLIIALESHYV